MERVSRAGSLSQLNLADANSLPRLRRLERPQAVQMSERPALSAFQTPCEDSQSRGDLRNNGRMYSYHFTKNIELPVC